MSALPSGSNWDPRASHTKSERARHKVLVHRHTRIGDASFKVSLTSAGRTRPHQGCRVAELQASRRQAGSAA